MPQTSEYKVIAATSVQEFQRELAGVVLDGWKPILLTSAGFTGVISYVAIVEGPM